MDWVEVQCPTCFEWFSVGAPEPNEWPTEFDYDCEICCRPLTIGFSEGGVVTKGLDEL
ncbi:MAG: CPXCG motif-containing cysteine-rich protein [Verrucomicrobiales bacterium]